RTDGNLHVEEEMNSRPRTIKLVDFVDDLKAGCLGDAHCTQTESMTIAELAEQLNQRRLRTGSRIRFSDATADLSLDPSALVEHHSQPGTIDRICRNDFIDYLNTVGLSDLQVTSPTRFAGDAELAKELDQPNLPTGSTTRIQFQDRTVVVHCRTDGNLDVEVAMDSRPRRIDQASFVADLNGGRLGKVTAPIVVTHTTPQLMFRSEDWEIDPAGEPPVTCSTGGELRKLRELRIATRQRPEIREAIPVYRRRGEENGSPAYSFARYPDGETGRLLSVLRIDMHVGYVSADAAERFQLAVDYILNDHKQLLLGNRFIVDIALTPDRDKAHLTKELHADTDVSLDPIAQEIREQLALPPRSSDHGPGFTEDELRQLRIQIADALRLRQFEQFRQRTRRKPPVDNATVQVHRRSGHDTTDDHDTTPAYDVARYTTVWDGPVAVIRIKTHIPPADPRNTDPEAGTQFLNDIQLRLDAENEGLTLLSGDRFIVDLIPVDDPAEAYLTIGPGSSPNVVGPILCEIRKHLGLPAHFTSSPLDLSSGELRQLSNDIAKANTPFTREDLTTTPRAPAATD
ncbi:MAG: hypothetical protein J2P17_31780, partial [Mycobacterium sp.]|nr:hypothetical protein [Mycobacterium sp.]